MCRTNVGQNTKSRLNNRTQLFHFAHQGNAGLENAQIVSFVNPDYGKRNTYLRVVAFRTSDDVVFRTQQKIQPFFYDGFSVTSRDSYDGKVKLFSVISGKLL